MIFKRLDLQTDDLKRPRRQTPSQTSEYLHLDSRRKSKPGRRTKSRKASAFDLSGFDLENPNDIFSAHQMLSSMGLWQDGHEGLFKLAMAAVMARRLATRNAAGYLKRIIDRGLWGAGLHGPAERDELAAKRIMQELDL